jgi:2-hydroxy-3-keto-5-methylthiopentenyl-1-phosphate phosphatase
LARAELVPSFPAGGAPVSVLVDYDGTISLVDVGDELMRRFVDDQRTLAEMDRAYDDGRLGSRELMLWDISVLPEDAELLRSTAETLPQDEAFPDFVAACRRWRADVEVVSDGFGFHVQPNLERLGLGDLPIATNETRLSGGERTMSFPYGHPRCFVCGTCKRERVRLHQAAERAVVFVGDGTSDRFAAAHADLTFAKGSLARICRQEGWSFEPWQTFADITPRLEALFEAGELPSRPEAYADWRARRAPAPRPFICGPEVWGEGRTVPGPGPR